MSDAASTPAPMVDDLSAPFWDACERGELVVQSCGACWHSQYPPLPICGRCQSDDLRWRTSARTGSIYSHSVVSRPVDPSFAVPYAVVIVQMDDDWFMLSNIIGPIDATIAVDARVELVFERQGNGVNLPKFRCVLPSA